MNKKTICNHRPGTGLLLRGFTLLLLLLAMSTGNLEAAPQARNVINAHPTYVIEGDDGIRYADVTVTLDLPRGSKSISVNYRTTGGSATVGGDYDAISGKITFAVGETRKTIRVPIHGDRIGEWDPYRSYYGGHEYFYVELSDPTGGGMLGYGNMAMVEIRDDEPQLRAYGADHYEGNSGTTPFTFTLSLSAPSDEVVTVRFATLDYTALAGIDYVPASGTLTFEPGETSKTITVDVLGNTLAEPDKYFIMNFDFSAVPSGVAISDSAVSGYIVDDDGYYDYYDPGIYYDGYDYGGYDYGNWYY